MVCNAIWYDRRSSLICCNEKINDVKLVGILKCGFISLFENDLDKSKYIFMEYSAQSQKTREWKIFMAWTHSRRKPDKNRVAYTLIKFK